MNYLNELESNTYPKYRLVVEIEYRTHNNIFESIESKIYKFADSVYDVSIIDGQIQIRGSINIGVLTLDQVKYEIRNVKVFSFDEGKVRKHNPKNYNDDMNAGLLLFKKDVIVILKKHYYLYDLTMYDKTNVDNKYLVDVLNDKVVFWEGEYNKLPSSIKDAIDVFNYGSDNEVEIISPGMMAWQLEANWKYHLKMYPEQQLAFVIKSKYFNAAIESGLTFTMPESLKEFSEFIHKIERITDINLTKFNQLHQDVKQLLKISNGELNELDTSELGLLYRKYCHQISRVIDNEFFK